MVASVSETIGSGGSYSTFAGWWADLPTGSPWAADYEARLLSDVAGDDLNVSFSGDMNGFKARVYTNTADRGNGGPDLPSISHTAANQLRIASGTVVIEFDGVKLSPTSTAAVARVFGGSWGITFRNCYLDGYSSSDPHAAPFVIENTVWVGASGQRGIDLRGSTATVINSLFRVSGDFGLLPDSGDAIRSTGVFGASNEDIWTGGGSGTQSYNVTSDTTAAGTGSVDSVTLTDTDQAGNIWLVEDLTTGDYRLVAATTGTNVAIDGGDPSNSTATDALGVTRDGSPDAGPFEFVGGGGGSTVPIGQAAETSSALAITAAKALAIGQATETDAAQPVTAVRIHSVGIATVTETAQPIGSAKAQALGQAAETDTALPIVNEKIISIGLADETDAALAAAALKALAIGQASETDAAQNLTAGRTHAIGQAAETSTAFAVGFGKVKVIGLASEADAAFAFTTGNVVSIGQAEETDLAQAFDSAKTRAIGLAASTETAQGITAGRVHSVGLAVESDTALPATVERALTIAVAEAVEQAFAIGALKTLAIGQAVEIDTAFSVTVAGVVTQRFFTATITVTPRFGGTVTVAPKFGGTVTIN